MLASVKDVFAPNGRMSDLDKFNYECEGQMSLFENEEFVMDRITTEFAEYICDNLCRYSNSKIGQDDLDEICDSCKMGQFICGILNEYNRINDFEQTQCHKLLQKIAELESRLGSEVLQDGRKSKIQSNQY